MWPFKTNRVAQVKIFVIHLCILSSLIVLLTRQSIFSSGTLIPTIGFTGFSQSLVPTLNLPLSYQLHTGYSDSTTWIFQLPFFWPLLVGDASNGTRLFMMWLIVSYYLIGLVVLNLFYHTFVGTSKTQFLPFSILGELALFLNYPFLYSLSAGALPFLFGIPILIYLLIKWYRLIRGIDIGVRELVKPGLVLGYLTLGDPRFGIWAVFALVPLLGVAVVRGSTRSRAAKLFVTTLLTLAPFVLLGLFTFTFGTGSLSYVSGRPLTFSTVSGFSLAYPLSSYFQFTALTWPAFQYTGPTILNASASTISSMQSLGYPPSVLVAGTSLVDQAWVVATMTTFSLGLVGLSSKRARPLAPYAFGLIGLLSVAIGSYLPIAPLESTYIALGHIPFLGGVFSITFAIPNYALIPVDSLVLFFALFFVLSMLSPDPRLSCRAKTSAGGPQRRRRNNVLRFLRFASPFVLVSLLLFANWQVVITPFAPGQYTPVLSGNGVPALGTLDPSSPPLQWQKAYDYFSSSDNGSYAVAWSQPYGFAYNWSKRTTNFVDPGVTPSPLFYNDLSQAIQQGAISETKVLMDDFGVRYFVVDNTSLSPISPLPPETIQGLRLFLSEGVGLVSIMNYSPCLYVFEDPNASLFEYYSSPPLEVPLSRNPLFAQTAFQTAFGETPVVLGQEYSGASHSVLETSEAVSSDEYSLKSGVDLNTGSTFNFDPALSFSYTPLDGVISIGAPWYYDGFNSNETIFGTPSAMSVSSAGRTPFTSQLSLGDFESPGHVGIQIPYGAGVNISFSLNGRLFGVGSTAQVVVVANNNRWQTIGGSTLYSAQLATGPGVVGTINSSYTIRPGYFSFDVILSIDNAMGFSLSNYSVKAVALTEAPQGAYASPYVFPDVPTNQVLYQNSTGGPPTIKEMNLTPSDGVVSLGNSWYFQDLSGNTSLQSRSNSVNISPIGACDPCATSASLSYGDFLSPGKIGIPIPGGAIPQLSVEFRYMAKGASVAPSFAAIANNASWRTVGGSSYLYTPLSPTSNWAYVNDSFILPMAQFSFSIDFQVLDTTSASFSILSLRYQFVAYANNSSMVSEQVSSPSNLPLLVTASVLGTGSVSAGNVTVKVDSTRPALIVISTVDTRPGGLVADMRGVSVNFVLVVPNSLRSLFDVGPIDAFSSYNSLEEEIRLTSSGANSLLIIRANGWTLPGSRQLDATYFGQSVYVQSISSGGQIEVRGAFVVNLLEISSSVGIFLAFAYLFASPRLLIRIRAGLTYLRR